MRILIIEDEIVIGRHIERILEDHFDCEVLLALSVDEAKELVVSFLPVLVLSDIHLNDAVDGIDLIGELQLLAYFETIFITSYQSKDVVERASLMEPANYILKPIDENQIVASVELVRNRLLRNQLAGTARVDVRGRLSKMEYDVLMLIKEKKTTRGIADALFISPFTVKNHRHNISRKLNLSGDNNALLRWVVENLA
jgi:DNA-binding NarL/FixJ family response regulator